MWENRVTYPDILLSLFHSSFLSLLQGSQKIQLGFNLFATLVLCLDYFILFFSVVISGPPVYAFANIISRG
jgi:hypothetical protein